MPIEKDLKDNTAALNANTAILQKLYDIKTTGAAIVAPTTATKVVKPTPAPVAPMSSPTVAPAPMAPAPAPAAVAQPAAVAAAPVQQSLVALSPEQMNEALVAEFQRVGDRTPIDAAMTALGVTSVNDLPADKQQELLAAVRAIPSPGVA